MAELLKIEKTDLSSELGKPSKLQVLLFDKFTECNSINQMSVDSGLHHHTIKTLLLSNGTSRKLTRSSSVLLSRYLNITTDEVELYRELIE